jgi:hypothetical protein
MKGVVLMDVLIDKLFSSDYVYLATVIGLLGLLSSYKSSQSTKHFTVDKDRLERVISPLFEAIEPFMKRNSTTIDEDHVNLFLKLIDSEPLLSGGILRDLRDNLHFDHKNKSFRLKEFNAFFEYVSREYDRLCHRTGIPLRKWSYRLRSYYWRFCYQALLFLLLQAIIYMIISLVIFLAYLGLGYHVVSSITRGTAPFFTGTVFIGITIFSIKSLLSENK